MIYLVTNVYFNKNIYNMDFRDSRLNKIHIKSSSNTFDLEVGDFVEVEIISKKNVIKEKITRPENFMDFYPIGKYEYNELYEIFKSYFNRIKNEKYKIILDETIFENLDYFKYPAAKAIHHAYIGGLAEHTLNMLELSEIFIDKYKLDRDLLWCGIILHDYSKINELTHYGLNYSIPGNLIGHLVMCVEEIVRVCNKYELEESMDITLLKHMILSHHGRMDYGSPKEPMIKEAYILSQLDEVDAKMNVLENAFSQCEEDSLTPPVMAFDKRRFFNYIYREEK